VIFLTLITTSLKANNHLKTYNKNIFKMNSKTIKTAVLVFGLAVLGSVEVAAQSGDKGPGKEPPSFSELVKEMDANKDGKLAKDEIKGPLKKDFAKVDTDEDGFISEAEFKKAPKPERKERSN